MKGGYFQKHGAVLFMGACSFFAASCSGAKIPAVDARTQQIEFSAPRDAVKTLRSALEKEDTDLLFKLFGPDSKDLLDSGDRVADAGRMKKFAARFSEGSSFLALTNNQKDKSGKDEIAILVGGNNWPFPIPLIQENGKWRFDTEAGKKEVLGRRIGNNELRAISVCIGVVDAEHEYREKPRAGSGTAAYATKFLSTKGKHDGLYWESKSGEPQSPIGPLVAQAVLEGYHPGDHKGPQPYHGYFYRILTKQGGKAPGGAKNYIKNGRMTEGFALVAYPDKWRVSGVMTFIVSADGVIYEKNLGEKNAEIASKITAYNPDKSWSKVGTT